MAMPEDYTNDRVPLTFGGILDIHTGWLDVLKVAPDLGGGEVSVAWADVSGKPATFPPATHTHAWGDITGKPTTFAPATHTHAWADVTGKPATFAPIIGTTAATAAAGDHTHSNYATTTALSDLEARVAVLEAASGA